jgi:hypothetical protein
MAAECGTTVRWKNESPQIVEAIQRLLTEGTSIDVRVRYLGVPGLPDFIDTIFQNGGKYTKLSQNYQRTIKYTKWP